LQNSARWLLRGCSRRRPIDQETTKHLDQNLLLRRGQVLRSRLHRSAQRIVANPYQPQKEMVKRGDSVTKRLRSWSFLARNVCIAQAGKSCLDVPEMRSQQNAPQQFCFRNIRDAVWPDLQFVHPSLRRPIFRPCRHLCAGCLRRLPTCSVSNDRKRHEDKSVS
jgi:hypothetical protein